MEAYPTDRQMVVALMDVIQPVRYHDRPTLREKAKSLKQSDGEGWAVGELLDRACLFLDAVNHGRELGAAEASGGDYQ